MSLAKRGIEPVSLAPHILKKFIEISQTLQISSAEEEEKGTPLTKLRHCNILQWQNKQSS